MTQDIAIVGMSALFPGARDLDSYWQNIINKVDAVTDAPDEWASPFFDPNSEENNRIYTRKGGFLGKLAEFNPIEFGIMPSSVDGGEPDQYLALKLARDALVDAGYLERPFNREKTAIIIGRGTYPNRGNMSLVEHGLIVDQTMSLLGQLLPNLDNNTRQQIRQGLKEGLPPFNAETAPGLVPNVMTGRIANRLDLMGANYIVDAACASSLIALELAMKELVDQRADMVLAGGVQASLLPVIAMIFCQLGALSRTNIRPFDESANGTLLGEGLGILVLKRLADAEKDGDRIYAVVKGVGSSSDGKGLGLMAPRFEGEVLAVKRAYEETKIELASIGLLEAHGTGISLGDRTEVSALSEVFGKRQGLLPNCAVGSVKSAIGHCLPAAGVAGIIKTALALYHKVLPPTLCDRVNPELAIDKTSLYINTEARPWIHGNPELPRRAAVNAFGFGGVNAHAILEEYREASPSFTSAVNLRTEIAAEPKASSLNSGELFAFSEGDRPALLNQVEKVRRLLRQHPDISLANLAYSLSETEFGSHRLAAIANSPEELEKKLKFAVEKLGDSNRKRLQTRNGIYYNERAREGKIAFLFPGEGSQYPNMLADLCVRFPQVRKWFDLLDEAFYGRRDYPPSSIIFPPPTTLTPEAQQFVKTQLYAQDVAVEVVFTACRALLDLLKEFEVPCDIIVGHSAGETTALAVAGIARLETKAQLIAAMRQMNQIYRHLEVENEIPEGTLLTVGGIERSQLNALLETSPEPAYLAMDNCPNQVVLYSTNRNFEQVSSHFKQAGGICTRLPYSRANHTPFNQAVTTALTPFYQSLDIAGGHTPLYSCANCEVFPADAEKIRDLAAKQWILPVRFRETIEKMYDEGVRTFIEVGPRSNLTAFVEDCLRGRDFLALASNRERISDLEQIQHLLARLFVNRVNVNLKPLYSGRGLRIVSWEEEDSEINSPKTSSVLELNVPTMRLQPDVVEAIQSTLLSENKDREANSQEFRENGSDTATPRTREPIQNSIAQTHAPTQQLKQPDPRLSILLGHFDLMQEFLASQQRVATSLYSPQISNSELGFAEAWPLLGRVIENSNGKLYCQKQFNIDRDIFLQDHTLGGTLSLFHPELLPLPIIPFTVSMEAIAEAAAYLAGGQKKVISFYNLRGYRWLALDRGTLSLDIVAQLLSEPRPDISDVYVQLFQSEGDRLLVFEGCVRLGDRFPSPPQPIPFDLSEPPQPSRFTDETLYSTGMFHKPRLRGVNRIRQWTKKGIEADLQVISTHDFFSDTRRPVLQTDAGLLDAVGQLVGYWVSEQFGFDFNVFPYHVEAVHLYAEQLPANFPLLGRGLMHFTSEEFTEANLDMIDNSGNVIARIEGWKDRYFAVPSHYYQCRLYPNIAYLSSSFLPESGVICRRIDPLPEGFLDNSWGIWKRALAHLMLNHNERDVWYELPEKGWCQTEWLLERIAAKDAVRQWAKQRLNLDLAPVDIELATTDAGKLFVSCPELASISPLPDVSVSYSNGYAIAAVGEPGTRVGIVLEWLEGDEARFKAAFDPQELAIPTSLDTRERKRAIAAVWCAKQAAAKAIGAGVQDNLKQWKISNYSPERIGITHAKTTFYAKLWQTDREIVAICQHSI